MVAADYGVHSAQPWVSPCARVKPQNKAQAREGEGEGDRRGAMRQQYVFQSHKDPNEHAPWIIFCFLSSLHNNVHSRGRYVFLI
jgi:hypothetical protein